MTIIQPKIYTRVRLWYAGGRREVFDVGYELKVPPNGMLTDIKGKLHGCNAEHVESFELEYWDAEVGISEEQPSKKER